MSQNREQLRQEIAFYIQKNPIREGERGCYDDICQRFGLTAEQVRRIYRTLKERTAQNEKAVSKTESKFQEDVKRGEADINIITEKRIKTLKDLIEVCDIDLNIWNIDWWECNKWEVGAKGVDLKIKVSPLFQVKAKLSRRKIDKDLELQKEAIIAELRAYKPSQETLDFNNQCTNSYKASEGNRDCLYEISIFDHHFGKLSWSPESGEDYDLKIAEKRWKDAVTDLVSRVNINSIEKILLPIGNDLFQSDNKNNTTTAGTVLDTDVRFWKMVKVVRRILIETIDKLVFIAPIDILIVPGNHDYHTSLWIGEVLDAFYHNSPLVNIDITPRSRKYYQYGKNGFQLTHGNEENHKELGLIFASEGKKLWGDTEHHFCQIGHTHKSKRIEYVSTDEFQGFQIQTLPSLCGTDAWHNKKGYISQKAAKSFLFHKTKGMIGEFTHTI